MGKQTVRVGGKAQAALPMQQRLGAAVAVRAVLLQPLTNLPSQGHLACIISSIPPTWEGTLMASEPSQELAVSSTPTAACAAQAGRG